jgi:pyruvate carboxylase
MRVHSLTLLVLPFANALHVSALPRAKAPVSAARLQSAPSRARAPVAKATAAAAAPSVFTSAVSGVAPPFRKVMACNRAEISVRIQRAATELNCETLAIYGNEDRYSQHRWGADQSFMLTKEDSASPISAYLDIPQIIRIAKENGVDAIHPGCGLARARHHAHSAARPLLGAPHLSLSYSLIAAPKAPAEARAVVARVMRSNV